MIGKMLRISLRQQSFGRRTVATLWIWIFGKWRSRWYKFGSALWIAHNRKTCIRILGGQTEILRLMNGIAADFQCGRWCILLIVIIAVVHSFQWLIFLFAVWYWHPFVNFHRGITNGYPFLFPMPNTIYSLHNPFNIILCSTSGFRTHRPWHNAQFV